MPLFGLRPHDCEVHGCRMEPRYDEIEVKAHVPAGLMLGWTPDEVRSLLVRRVYVGEVCTRCGKTSGRPAQEASRP